jgi:hypothetical protein
VSLKIENAGPVSLARTMDIVMAFVYQVVVLNTQVQITSLIGAIIICFGVILLALHKWYQQKPELFLSLLPFKHSTTSALSADCKPSSVDLADLPSKSKATKSDEAVV